MALRTTSSLLLSGTALSGPKRVSAHFLLSVIPLAGHKQVTAHYLVTPAAYAGAKRMTAHYLMGAVSIHTRIEFILLDSDSEIFGVDHYTTTLASFPIPEHNPYRPRIPEQLVKHGDDFYDFFEENQQILREQHNITQTGDTTFPYQLIIGAHDNQLYKLGSIGRFYHEDYGVALARYVQFDNMMDVDTPSCPVGLFKKAEQLEWVVTNDFTQSNADLVVGISAPFTTPVNKQYGWVVVDGPIYQPVKNTSTTVALGESFVWDASGSVSNSGEGKIVGRRVNKLVGTTKSLLAGQMWVRLESTSEGSIKALVDATIQDLRDTVEQLQADLAALPGGAAIQTLQASINAVKVQLQLETTARKAVDQQIQDQIADLNVVTGDVLDVAIMQVTNLITTTAANLQAKIDEARVIALDALAKANAALAIDFTSLQTQISEISAYLGAERKRAKGRFPVVDGSVPPNLVYLDDGSLVYTETF